MIPQYVALLKMLHPAALLRIAGSMLIYDKAVYHTIINGLIQ